MRRFSMTVNSEEELLKLDSRPLSDTRIVIAAGKYRLQKPVRIDGWRDVDVVCDDGAIFCGCRPIEDWTQEGDRACACLSDRPTVRGLVREGRSLPIARYPKYDPALPMGGSCRWDDPRIASWTEVEDGYVRGLHEYDWGGNSYRIVGRKSGCRGWDSFRLEWAGDNNRGNKLDLEKLTFENLEEEASLPDEWYYRPKTGLLARIGDASQNAEAIVNYAAFAIDDCQNVTFEGGRFCFFADTVFDYPYERPLRGDWAIQRKGCLHVRRSKGIVLRKLQFEEVGCNCVLLDGNVSDCEIRESDFRRCGASGVLIQGSLDACREPSSWEDHKTRISDLQAGPKSEDYVRRVTVENCYFYDLGRKEKQCAAVGIGIAEEITVKNCTVHRMPRAGINISDGTFGGHSIENNDLFDCVRETCDHGPFNAWGRDRYWSLKKYNATGKYGKAKRPFSLLDAYRTTRILNNRVTGIRGFGIDLDDGCSNYEIARNVCIGVGIKIREGFDRFVHDNLLWNATVDVHCSFAKCGDRVERNLFVRSRKPLNEVLTNRGSNLQFLGNYYCQTDPPARDRAPIRVELPADVDPLRYQWTARIAGMQTIGDSIGCQGAPVPSREEVTCESSADATQRFGLRLLPFDEGLRSVCGLKDCKGAYVDKVKPFSVLRKYLQKGDAVLKVDASAVEKPSEWTNLPRVSITVMRDQKVVELPIVGRRTWRRKRGAGR